MVGARLRADRQQVIKGVMTYEQGQSKGSTTRMQAYKGAIHSTLRERIIEHVFIGDVLRILWRHDIVDVEVLRSECDAYGYDLVFCRGPLVRHIQLKSQGRKKISTVSVGRALAEKPSGCVIWIQLDPGTLELGPFRWFGGPPGERLPDISAYPNPLHPRHNKAGQRPPRRNHHEVPLSAFQQLRTIDELVVRLFGELPSV